MAIPIAQWAEQIKKDPRFFDENGVLKYGEVVQTTFFRDPCRLVMREDDVFTAGADGFIISNGIYDIAEDTYMLKGAEFDLETIIGNDQTFWDYMEKKKVKYVQIVSIFMTFYSPHINRYPIDSKLLRQTYLPPVLTKNQSMIPVEDQALLGDFTKINFEDVEAYYSYNERVVSHLMELNSGLHYECVQIADVDVNAIWTIHDSSSEFVRGGQRCGGIRRGSTFDLILPLVPGFNFEVLPAAQPGMVVKAGTDQLVRMWW